MACTASKINVFLKVIWILLWFIVFHLQQVDVSVMIVHGWAVI